MGERGVRCELVVRVARPPRGRRGQWRVLRRKMEGERLLDEEGEGLLGLLEVHSLGWCR